MPRYYPVFLNLSGKSTVVIGGGEVAERKVASLLASAAQVTVISPELTPELERLAQAGSIVAQRRPYVPGDLADAYLAIVSTDDPAVNHQAAQEARRSHVLVNTVDDVTYCDFIAPAVVQRGDLTVAISTNGKSPAMARFVRRELERFITEEYSALLNVLEEVRVELRRRRVHPSPDRWQEHITPELITLVRQGKHQQARETLLAELTCAAAEEWRLQSQQAAWCNQILEAARRSGVRVKASPAIGALH